MDSLGLADKRGEAAAKRKQQKTTRDSTNAASKAARRQGLKSSLATPDWFGYPATRRQPRRVVCACVFVCVGGVCVSVRQVHVRNIDVNLDVLQDWPSQGRPTKS